MDNYTVYKHTSPSGKMYVGITKQDVEKRWANGEGYKNCTYFYNAIQKYGWDNFNHEILYTGLSLDEACKIEEKLVNELDLLNPEKGYNLKTGGRYGVLTKSSREKISKSLQGNKRRLGIPHTDETIEHMKETRVGKNPHDWSDESKEKMRQYRLGKKASKKTKELLSEMRTGSGNPFYGKHHTDETKEKLRQINLGHKHTEETKKKMSEIRKGKPINITEEGRANRLKAHNKPVVQLSLEGEFIKEWDNIKEPEETLNIHHITEVCRGKRNSAGNFIWKYKEDYDGRRT